MKRVSLSLDDDVVQTLTLVSRRVGLSRSAFVNAMLRESKPQLDLMLDMVPEDGSSIDAKRFRSESVDMITEQYRQLVQGVLEFPNDGGESQG